MAAFSAGKALEEKSGKETVRKTIRKTVIAENERGERHGSR